MDKGANFRVRCRHGCLVALQIRSHMARAVFVQHPMVREKHRTESETILQRTFSVRIVSHNFDNSRQLTAMVFSSFFLAGGGGVSADTQGTARLARTVDSDIFVLKEAHP